MSEDTIIGLDLRNDHIFFSRTAFTESGEKVWIGSDPECLLVVHHNVRDALDFFIGRHPGCTGVRIIINNKFEHVDLGAAARKLMLDGIMSTVNGMNEDTKGTET